MKRRSATLLGCLIVTLVFSGVPGMSSSHREAPFITKLPKVDSTDFYMFRSYEAGRENFVTLVANYLPLQDPYGAPNYFSLDPEAVYNIHIDNNGDAQEDLTFRFQFTNTNKDIQLDVGPPGGTQKVSIALLNAGVISAGNTGLLNVVETYTVDVLSGRPTNVFGSKVPGTPQPVTNASTGSGTFVKPVDNIGNKSIPNYAAYAAAHVYSVNIPGCSTPGRLFVGQRKDSFIINIGEVFDLVNISNPLGPRNVEADDLANKNVTSLALELPIACITTPGNPTIGAWTTAGIRRLQLYQEFFRPGGPVSTGSTRTARLVRYCASITSIASKAAGLQNDLGVIGGDTAGFPNGGEDPAGLARIDSAGVMVIGYRSNTSLVELEPEKFEQYLREEGLEQIIARRAELAHGARKVREIYSRCAKALVAGGAGALSGYDRVVGFTLELVPENNPYELKPGEEFKVRLLYEGKPVKGVLVAALSRKAPEQPHSARTDDDGRASLKLPHSGVWLVKAVHMIPAQDEAIADWESLWASLTFEVAPK